MPRTKGWSCCACQTGSAAWRSSALKLTEQGVPVEELVALEQPRGAPDAPLRHAPLEAGGDHGQGIGLEVAVRLGEQVEEPDLVGRQAVAAGQGPAHPGAVLSPRGEVD